MKQQGKSSSDARLLSGAQRDLQAAYRMLDRTVSRHPWLLQGSVNVVAPKSPASSVTYTWTRKVRAKTITVALSQQQADADFGLFDRSFRTLLTSSRSEATLVA
jgi:hypothetical protein